MSIYSAPGTASNPFHVKELTEADFRETLSTAFHNVAIVRQRAFFGSAILPDAMANGTSSLAIFEQRDTQTFEADRRLLRAPYLLAVASDQDLPATGLSLYIQNSCTEPEVLSELERLRSVERKFREQEPAAAKAFEDAAALPIFRAELERFRADVPPLQAELERLRAVEDKVREDAPAMSQALQDASRLPVMQLELEGLRAEAENLRSEVDSLRAEAAEYKLTGEALHHQLQRLGKELDSMQEEKRALLEELQGEREEGSATQSQLVVSASLARQQSMTVQRSLLQVRMMREELENCKKELENSRQELAGYRAGYQQAASLLIPLRIRRAVPDSFKPPLRAVKRVLRSVLRNQSHS